MFLGNRARPVFKASKLTAICDPTAYTMWDPEHLTILWASTACYGDSFTFSYVDNVRTSQETHLCASTASYGDNVTFLYVDDVCTSQETYLWASTACYGDKFPFIFLQRGWVLYKHSSVCIFLNAS
jgi:hypothetical protein